LPPPLSYGSISLLEGWSLLFASIRSAYTHPFYYCSGCGPPPALPPLFPYGDVRWSFSFSFQRQLFFPRASRPTLLKRNSYKCRSMFIYPPFRFVFSLTHAFEVAFRETFPFSPPFNLSVQVLPTTHSPPLGSPFFHEQLGVFKTISLFTRGGIVVRILCPPLPSRPPRSLQKCLVRLQKMNSSGFPSYDSHYLFHPGVTHFTSPLSQVGAPPQSLFPFLPSWSTSKLPSHVEWCTYPSFSSRRVRPNFLAQPDRPSPPSFPLK